MALGGRAEEVELRACYRWIAGGRPPAARREPGVPCER